MPTIEEQYLSKHPTSKETYANATEVFPDGVTHDNRFLMPFPIVATHANGSRKWDVDGNEYVDYVMGHGALLLGHSHPDVVNAVTGKMAQGTHLGANTKDELEWGRLVQQLIPSAERVRFTSSGTEATLLALRLVRAFTGKNRVIKFQNHFHGWHDFLLAGSGRNMGGIAPEVAAMSYVLPPNDIAAVERTIRENDDIAAVILEPTGAGMGQIPVYPQFLKELRATTTNYGIVLIFDEVVTGFRMSPGGAQALYDVTPDVTTLAKILAGGLSGGAVSGRADILNMIAHDNSNGDNRVGHAGTFNANPLVAAAGAATLSLVSSGEHNAKADASAAALRRGINDIMTRMEIPGCCYGLASVFQLRLGVPCQCNDDDHQHPKESQGATPPTLVRQLRLAALNAGMDLMGGRSGLVSSAHTQDDVRQSLASFEEAFAALRTDGLV
ncbi:MAG: aspartate aminotransferase family protein [Chloroflexota bacterium]|nr:aspartate aminotransferase family protein [Chloroflexota bacterium]